MSTIFTALAPNFELDDAWLALKLLFQPWRWKHNNQGRTLINGMILFDSGRTGLEAILRCMDIGPGDEVLLQAFTCVAVPNSVLWAGAKPIYVDCNEQYTMSVEDLKQKITLRQAQGKHPKAVIIQHTFGIMADVEAIKAIVGHHVLVIEDCAHSFADSGKGDASFYSFGRDKVISSVFGGGVKVKNQELFEKIQEYQKSLPMPSYFWIKRQLLYVPVMVFIRATYDWGLGKVLLAIVRKLHIFSKPVEAVEKNGKKPDFVGKQMPNALILLATHQFTKLEKFNVHRKKIAEIYRKTFSGYGVLRFVVKMRLKNKPNNIFLGDWYTTAIAPAGVSYEAIGYDPATCPTAERLATQTINLPNDIHITEHDAHRIISTIKSLGAV